VLLVSFVLIAAKYRSDRASLTYEYPPGTGREIHLAGKWMTPWAKEILDRDRIPVSVLVDNVGTTEENLSLIWTPESRRAAETQLTILYVLMVITLATAVFCLTEGLMGNSRPNPVRH
jgi:hypothetical protein